LNQNRWVRKEVPILEHDPARVAYIEPSEQIRPRDVPEHCVICFFQDVLDEVIDSHRAKMLVENRWENGPHPLYEVELNQRRLAFFHPGVGGSLAAGLLEEVVAFGCKKFIVCGGCGVLDGGILLGHLVVVTSAVRDEGVSYHYLPPSREVQANPNATEALVSVLEAKEIPFIRGKTWTTDAPYRETHQKIAARREEECLTVEMEAASLMAVAEFRRVPLGQVLYGGDDLSGSVWDRRNWQSRQDVRRNLFWIAAEACLKL